MSHFRRISSPDQATSSSVFGADRLSGFAPETMIETCDGEKPAEDIHAGDLVRTADHGLQPVRHVLRLSDDAYWSVVFDADAMGNLRQLVVGAEQRVLVAAMAHALFAAEPEGLIPANALIDDVKIRGVQTKGPRIQLAFDAHEIIIAEGLATESEDLNGLSNPARPILSGM